MRVLVCSTITPIHSLIIMFKRKTKKQLVYRLLSRVRVKHSYSSITKLNLFSLNKCITCHNGITTFMLKQNSHFFLNKSLFKFIVTRQPKPYPFKKIKN